MYRRDVRGLWQRERVCRQPGSLDTLDGSNGFRLDGIDANDNSGFSVSTAGDVNGDGYDDILVGANRARPGW